MAYYKIDLNNISEKISKIRSSVDEFDALFKQANNNVHALSSSWYGVDSSYFETSWNNFTNDGNTYDKYCEEIEKYYHYLCQVKTTYSDFQSRAIQKSFGS